MYNTNTCCFSIRLFYDTISTFNVTYRIRMRSGRSVYFITVAALSSLMSRDWRKPRNNAVRMCYHQTGIRNGQHYVINDVISLKNFMTSLIFHMRATCGTHLFIRCLITQKTFIDNKYKLWSSSLHNNVHRLCTLYTPGETVDNWEQVAIYRNGYRCCGVCVCLCHRPQVFISIQSWSVVLLSESGVPRRPDIKSRVATNQHVPLLPTSPPPTADGLQNSSVQKFVRPSVRVRRHSLVFKWYIQCV